jgi:hypothetical protein
VNQGHSRKITIQTKNPNIFIFLSLSLSLFTKTHKHIIMKLQCFCCSKSIYLKHYRGHKPLCFDCLRRKNQHTQNEQHGGDILATTQTLVDKLRQTPAELFTSYLDPTIVLRFNFAIEQLIEHAFSQKNVQQVLLDIVVGIDPPPTAYQQDSEDELDDHQHFFQSWCNCYHSSTFEHCANFSAFVPILENMVKIGRWYAFKQLWRHGVEVVFPHNNFKEEYLTALCLNKIAHAISDHLTGIRPIVTWLFDNLQEQESKLSVIKQAADILENNLDRMRKHPLIQHFATYNKAYEVLPLEYWAEPEEFDAQTGDRIVKGDIFLTYTRDGGLTCAQRRYLHPYYNQFLDMNGKPLFDTPENFHRGCFLMIENNWITSRDDPRFATPRCWSGSSVECGGFDSETYDRNDPRMYWRQRGGEDTASTLNKSDRWDCLDHPAFGGNKFPWYIPFCLFKNKKEGDIVRFRYIFAELPEHHNTFTIELRCRNTGYRSNGTKFEQRLSSLEGETCNLMHNKCQQSRILYMVQADCPKLIAACNNIHVCRDYLKKLVEADSKFTSMLELIDHCKKMRCEELERRALEKKAQASWVILPEVDQLEQKQQAMVPDADEQKSIPISPISKANPNLVAIVRFLVDDKELIDPPYDLSANELQELLDLNEAPRPLSDLLNILRTMANDGIKVRDARALIDAVKIRKQREINEINEYLSEHQGYRLWIHQV